MSNEGGGRRGPRRRQLGSCRCRRGGRAQALHPVGSAKFWKRNGEGIFLRTLRSLAQLERGAPLIVAAAEDGSSSAAMQCMRGQNASRTV